LNKEKEKANTSKKKCYIHNEKNSITTKIVQEKNTRKLKRSMDRQYYSAPVKTFPLLRVLRIN